MVNYIQPSDIETARKMVNLIKREQPENADEWAAIEHELTDMELKQWHYTKHQA